MRICPIILAGGSGTRLWPLSREFYPKQLLPLHGTETLLQATVTRLDGLETRAAGLVGADGVRVDRPVVVANEEHRFLIEGQLREVGRAPARILLEPAGRNTAPALTLAALAAWAEDDPVLLVMPADHVIGDLPAFQAAAARALELAGAGRIVTFGVVPTRPETGYGYIRRGRVLAGASPEAAPPGYRLDAFVEKPDVETAHHYLESGEYLWNSGMFVLRASVWLRALQNLQPAMAAACRESYQTGTADGPFYRVGREAFERGPADSIDYAVMERLVQPSLAHDDLPEAAVVPLQAGWSDVGAWSALWDIRPADALGNVTEGDVYTHDTHDSLLLAGHRFVAALGVDHVVVIETPDAVLVTRKDRAQDVRHVVQWLKAQQRPEAETHRKVYRPWGSYESLDAGERFRVKRLTLYPGQAISLQMHHHRAEHWVVVRGTARVSRNEESFLLTENQSTYIPIGTTHRLENPGVLPLEIIEVQSGGYLGEDDVVRFEDRYHRTGGE